MKKIWQNILIIIILLFGSCVVVLADKPRELIVVLDWFTNPNHAPLFVAEQEGLFAKYGLKVKLIIPADATQGEKMVGANRADVAITYQPTLVSHVVQGLPLIRFATLIAGPLNCVVTLGNGPVRSLKDLRGKRIGTSAAEIDNVIFTTMLNHVGLSLKDVEVVNIGFNLTSALLTQKIDAFVGGMRNFEPKAITLAGKVAQVFYPEKYGFPKFDELILVTNKNKVHDEVLVSFTRALEDGVSYLRNNPHKSWEKFALLHPELNNQLNKEAWFATLPYFATFPAKLDNKRYQELARFMWQKKQIVRLPEVAEYAVELY